MKYIRFLFLACLPALLTALPAQDAAAGRKISVAVFRFNAGNLEASSYGATVTTLLSDALVRCASVCLLDRKELEGFLALNDLEQDEKTENMVAIGNRLGLGVVVAGSVTKKGPVIIVDCKAVQICDRRILLSRRLKMLGEGQLEGEVSKLAALLCTTLARDALRSAENPTKRPATLEPPRGLIARSGPSSVSLYWEGDPRAKGRSYIIYRAVREGGPFTRIGKTEKPEFTDTRASKGTAYFYKIKACDTRGAESEFSTVVSGQPEITPEPPIILSAKGFARAVRLVWSPNPIERQEAGKIRGFRVYRATRNGGSYKMVAELTDLDGLEKQDFRGLKSYQFVDENLVDGRKYFYRMSCFDENGSESDFSIPVAAKTIPAVAGLWVQGGLIRSMRLGWNASDSLLVKGYRIYRSESKRRGFRKIKEILGREINSFTDEQDLKDDTKYYYRVTLVDESGRESSPSPTVGAKTKGAPPPVQVAYALGGLVKKVALRWIPLAAEDVVGYRIYRSRNPRGPFKLIKSIDSPSCTEYVDEGNFQEPLGDNITYHYRITTYNPVNVESKVWAYVNATTKRRPTAPRGLKSEGLHVKSVPLAWQPNPEPDIVKYHIYRKSQTSDHFEFIKTVGNVCSYVDKGLGDGIQYSYRIQAEDKDGLRSKLSAVANASTKPRPRKPSQVKGDYLEGVVVLMWEPNREPDIVCYNILEKTFFGFSRIATVTSTSCSLKGIEKGEERAYAVTAVDRDGLESEPSDAVIINTHSPPAVTQPTTGLDLMAE